MKISPMAFVLVGVITYLSYHAIAGRQGLSQWSTLQETVKELEKERNDLALKQLELELQIVRLSGDTIDDDYLEELVRQQLHFVYPGEIVLDPPEFTSLPPVNEDLFALSN